MPQHKWVEKKPDERNFPNIKRTCANCGIGYQFRYSDECTPWDYKGYINNGTGIR